jgi:multiple sugar transport system substrate-binding protein
MKKLLSLLLVTAVVFGSASAVIAAEEVTLEYWIAGDVRRTPVYQESIDRFTERTGIKVNITEEVGDNTQIQQKLFTMIAANSAPDVLHVDTMYVADMAKAGTILPLDEFDGFQNLFDDIIAAEIAPLVVDGKTYGFPIRGNSIQLCYNKQMFRDAGLDPDNPPKTYDELIDAAIALTKRDASGNVEVYGYEIGMTADSHWTMHVFSPIFWSYGGEYVNEDGTSGFANEAGVKTLALWNKLVNELKVSPVERVSNGFVSEKLAMSVDGEWNIRAWREDYPELDVGMATLPMPSEDIVPQLPLGGRACVIPVMSKNHEASWKLIQHVISFEEQMSYTKQEVGLGVRNDMVDDPWFDENPLYKTVLLDMQYAKPKAAPEILQMDTIVFDAIQQVLLMGADPLEALQTADDTYNDILSSLE